MTQSEWFTTNDIHNMLIFAKPSERKIRLFAIACYRHAVKPEKYKPELRLAESYVAGTTHKNTLHIVYERMNHLWRRDCPEFCLVFTVSNLDNIIKIVSRGTKIMSKLYMVSNRSVERKWQANLLRHMIKIKW